MTIQENTFNIEEKEDQPSQKKTYTKPAIEEEAALPTATASALTPVVPN